MKILALDIGDKWVGSAISDALKITCKPYKTIAIDHLEEFIKKTLEEEQINNVIVGYPKTMKGEESEQTKKTVKIKKRLEELFSKVKGKLIQWVLWDERLSSKRAQTKIDVRSSRKARLLEHSIAAAFILQSYLDFKAFN